MILSKPYPFQRKAVRQIRLEFDGRALLAAKPGLGKSLQSLMFADQTPEARPVIIICFAPLKWNWEAEVEKHLGDRTIVLNGQKPPKNWKTTAPFIIINYDVLHFWVNELKAIKPQLIIVDESQAIRNRYSKRTKATRLLCRGVPHVLMLTGTPLMNCPADLWSILNILQPKKFPTFFPFAVRHCDPQLKQWGWEFRGATNLKELHQTLLANGMIRIRTEDVMKELPLKRRIVVPLELSNRSEYDKAENDYLHWIEQKDITRLDSARQAEMRTKMQALRILAARGKFPHAVPAWIDNFLESSEKGKLIVFCIHKEIVRQLRERWENISVTVDGSVTGKKREQAFKSFIHGKPRLFFGNIQAAGAGWSAKGCSNNAFIEFPWLPAELTQGEARTEGIGRGEKGIRSISWNLFAKDTIEEKLLMILQRRQKIANEAIDGDGGGDQLDIYTQVTQLMRKGK